MHSAAPQNGVPAITSDFSTCNDDARPLQPPATSAFYPTTYRVAAAITPLAPCTAPGQNGLPTLLLCALPAKNTERLYPLCAKVITTGKELVAWQGSLVALLPKAVNAENPLLAWPVKPTSNVAVPYYRHSRKRTQPPLAVPGPPRSMGGGLTPAPPITPDVCSCSPEAPHFPHHIHRLHGRVRQSDPRHGLRRPCNVGRGPTSNPSQPQSRHASLSPDSRRRFRSGSGSSSMGAGDRQISSTCP